MYDTILIRKYLFTVEPALLVATLQQDKTTSKVFGQGVENYTLVHYVLCVGFADFLSFVVLLDS